MFFICFRGSFCGRMWLRRKLNTSMSAAQCPNHREPPTPQDENFNALNMISHMRWNIMENPNDYVLQVFSHSSFYIFKISSVVKLWHTLSLYMFQEGILLDDDSDEHIDGDGGDWRFLSLEPWWRWCWQGKQVKDLWFNIDFASIRFKSFLSLHLVTLSSGCFGWKRWWWLRSWRWPEQRAKEIFVLEIRHARAIRQCLDNDVCEDDEDENGDGDD